MMACIYFGIAPLPKAKTKKQPPSFTGFFFLSAGLALLFAALDQGRLDSGTFTALFAGAIGRGLDVHFIADREWQSKGAKVRAELGTVMNNLVDPLVPKNG
jgi:hypothetical protein